MSLAQASTVYGPVKSWRVGASLGIDLLFVDSICSFRCVYCQLGKINVHTSERKVYVTTQRVLDDLKVADWQSADIITISGSGEPTLAANLGEVIDEIKSFTGKPVLVLTNAAHLDNVAVRRDLCRADRVFCKLDAVDEATFQRIDRPVAGLTLRGIIDGIKVLRQEFDGYFGIQFMLTEMNKGGVTELAAILNEIRPDELQLNAPLRPVPREYTIDTRGNHVTTEPQVGNFKPVSKAETEQIVKLLQESTGLKIVSPYR